MNFLKKHGHTIVLVLGAGLIGYWIGYNAPLTPAAPAAPAVTK